MGCVYCGVGKATKEHVWSDSILRLFEPSASLTIDVARRLVHGADPVIKDVCKACNNGSSLADRAAKGFVEKYLLAEIPDGTVVNAGNADLIHLWATKTAANHERQAKKGSQWWKPHVEYLRGNGSKPESVAVWFAAWRNKNPINDLGVVYELMAREARFVKCASMQITDANGCLNRGWALKVGWGVFLVFDQKPDIHDRTAPLWDEIKKWGWIPLADDMAVTGSPFNVWTSQQFQLLGPRDMAADEMLGGLRAQVPVEPSSG